MAGSCSANNFRSWAKRLRSPGRTGEPGEGNSWNDVNIGTQMLGAIRQVADTLAGNVSRGSIERGSVGAGHGLGRESHHISV